MASDGLMLTKDAPQYDAPRIQKRSASSDTFTYVKCAYKTSNDDSDPSTSWEWATKNGDYVKLKGYWYSSGILSNMFYTDVTSKEIKGLCKSTLQDKGINSSIVMPYASDYTLSYYYMIWNQGQQPSVKLGNNEIDRMVIFGDSLSDTVNVYNGSYGTVPNHKSWFLGHFSNGKVWHEYLSEDLNIPSYAWATGNAESGEKNLFNGLGKQVDSFKEYYVYSKGYDIKKTLFMVLFGGNDLITGGKTANNILDEYANKLTYLASLGARQVAVFRLPDFSVIPNVSGWKDDDKRKLKENVIAFNDGVEKLILKLKKENPSTNFYTLPLDGVFDNLINNASQNGFVNSKETCLNIGGSGINYITGVNVKKECKDSNAAFVFWDNMHPTTKTYRLISERIKGDVVNGLNGNK